jgi:two-component system cell cycle response regulator DivK
MTTILIVEDNEMNRDMLSRRLEKKGFGIVLAFDGQAGIEAAAAHKPDLILMDLSLPVMDGWQATQRLKADVALRRIPIVALSAHAMATDREKALGAGCDDFDTKPIDMPRLIAKIDALLTRTEEGTL